MPEPEFPPPTAQDRSPDLPAEATIPPPAPPAPAPAPRGRREPGAFKRGFGLGAGLGIGLGTASLVLSLVMGLLLTVFGLLALVGGGAGQTSSSTTTIWGSGSQVIRAISVTGAIMADASDGSLLSEGTYGYEVAQEIDGLDGGDVSALVLLVNTPGGSIGGSKAISDAVERFQARTGKKVLVHVSSMSASGGVYATATADEIVADYGALVGSIGVIFGPFDYYDTVTATSGSLFESGVTTSGGITSEYLTQGTGKDFGNPYRAMTEQEREHYTAGLKNEYDAFVEHVSANRGIPAEVIVDELGAFLFDPTRAQEVGLIDSVMGQDDFFAHAAQSAGLDPGDTRIEMVRQPTGLEALLGMERALGTAPAAQQGAGVHPVLSASICGRGQPLAYAGDLSAVCG